MKKSVRGTLTVQDIIHYLKFSRFHYLFSLLAAIGAMTIIASPAMALEDGWYKAKQATGACANDLKDAVLAVEGNRALSLSAEGQSATFIDPAPLDKKPKRMRATAARGTGTVEIFVNPDKSITLKVVEAEECLGAKIVFVH